MKIDLEKKNNFLAACPKNKFGRALFTISTLLAIFGGIVLLLIVFINVFSIVGRVLFSSPLMGDFELVEMGCAIAIFSFLPLCHLSKGNVIVDFFTLGLNKRVHQILDGASSFLYAVVALFFAWRMVYGAEDMLRYNEQTMLLKLPVWIAFIPGIFSFLLLFISCFYTFIMSFQRSGAES